MVEETIESSLITGKVRLQNKNFSLLYSVKKDQVHGYKILLKLFNEVLGKPVAKSGILLSEKELESVLEALSKAKERLKNDIPN